MPREWNELTRITRGEDIIIEQKYKKPKTIQPVAKWVVVCNEFPRVHDYTDAFWNRLILVNYEHVIPKELRNEKYRKPDFWLASGEMSKILNFAIEGYLHIIKHGFTESDRQKELLQERVHENNPVRAAIEDLFTEDINSQLEKNSTLKEIEIWMEENHGGMSKKITKTRITKEIKRIFKNVDIIRPRSNNGTRPRYFCGIRKKYESEQDLGTGLRVDSSILDPEL